LNWTLKIKSLWLSAILRFHQFRPIRLSPEPQCGTGGFIQKQIAQQPIANKNPPHHRITLKSNRPAGKQSLETPKTFDWPKLQQFSSQILERHGNILA
jgi:hypothetical protein